MKRPKQQRLPNYLRKLAYLVKTGAIPKDVGAHLIDVAHDDWCGVFQGKMCDCDPAVRLRVSVPGSMN